MLIRLDELISAQAEHRPQAEALVHGRSRLSYAELATELSTASAALLSSDLGLRRYDRVAVYLPKCIDAVVGLFATLAAGAVMVPINPLLKPAQVAHILRDSGARWLLTSGERLSALDASQALDDCPALRAVLLTNHAPSDHGGGIASGQRQPARLDWRALRSASAMSVGVAAQGAVTETDLAAILYTSGSSGRPKGVALSQRNLLCGARSVADYLGHRAEDRLLALLPLSFDAGFSQLSTAFAVGARVVLLEFLLAREVAQVIEREAITAVTGVPPLWNQLAALNWSPEACACLRYIANTGGHLPAQTLTALRGKLPSTEVFLMYGLTEAFRSTYLPPAQIERRPSSIGKAIPNAEVLVVRADGSECAVDEPGELVHRGPLVALGYWNDAKQTARRFRPAPAQPAGLVHPELAVWSGDTVRRDEDGYLYFLGRDDAMIKTSGYRVSPTEIEQVVDAAGGIHESVALGVAHRELGQAVVVVLVPAPDYDRTVLDAHLANELPAYMRPLQVLERAALPRTPNGKIDRRCLADELPRPADP